MAGFDNLEGYIWIDGQFYDWKDAKVHFLTHGLHYASAVFEGIRSYAGSAFKLTQHNERLIKSAEIMDMKVPYSVEELNEVTYQVLEKNNLEDSYIRPLVWRGSEMMAISNQNATVHVGIAAWGGIKYSAKSAEGGIKLKKVSWRRPDPKTAPVHAKASGLYMISTLSKHEAERAGCEDALMLDYQGNVAEASGANIFFLKGGELHTPTPHCFLNGITRQTAIEIAEGMGIKVNVRTIKPEELPDMDECFITGTAAEITPVEQIEEIKYGVGENTRKIVEAYHDLVHQPAPEKLAREAA